MQGEAFQYYGVDMGQQDVAAGSHVFTSSMFESPMQQDVAHDKDDFDMHTMEIRAQRSFPPMLDIPVSGHHKEIYHPGGGAVRGFDQNRIIDRFDPRTGVLSAPPQKNGKPLLVELFVRPDHFGSLGFNSSKLPPHPVVVASVEPGTWANEQGLRAGDELLQIQEQDVKSLSAPQLAYLMKHRPLKLKFSLKKTVFTEREAWSNYVEKHVQGNHQRAYAASLQPKAAEPVTSYELGQWAASNLPGREPSWAQKLRSKIPRFFFRRISPFSRNSKMICGEDHVAADTSALKHVQHNQAVGQVWAHFTVANQGFSMGSIGSTCQGSDMDLAASSLRSASFVDEFELLPSRVSPGVPRGIPPPLGG